jgi:C1A family cysteine protease
MEKRFGGNVMISGSTRIKAFLSTVTLLSLLFCSSAVSFSAEIDDIKAAIIAKNAKWHADVTTVHKLDRATRRSRVGLTLPASTASVPEQTSMASPLSAPTGGFDWRNNVGTNYVTPIKDQGNCGSCWAFASTGALESYTLIHGTYNPTLNLSEQILVSCSGAGSCNGGTLDGAASYIQYTGLPIEKDDPYTATNSACSAAVSGWTSSTDKIFMWEWISAGAAPTASTLKNAVYTYGPVVVAMNVYSDFYAYRSGVYTYTTGAYEGGHAILVVGYADDASSPGGGYFIVKNSWGTGWGEPFGADAGGYFRIGYSELNSPVQFASYSLAYDPSTPTSNYSLSPTNSTMSNAAGSGKITVTAGNSSVWLAKSSATWITLASSAAVTGNGTISYSVAANTTSGPRTGTISLTNKNSNVVGTFTLTQQAQPVTYAVTGTVKSNSSTGSTIAGASISFAGKTTTTAGNGTFSITGVAAGTYALAISAPGYAPYTSNITLNANQTIVAALTPASYTLTGTIRNGSPTGPGLAGATVAVAGKSATTANDGTFSITGIGGGTYTMVVSKTGYVSAISQPFTMNTNLVAALYLMPQTYSVSGTVTSAAVAGSNTAALSGALVSIAGKSALTGSTGTFSISGLAPGTYPVTASKTGYNNYTGSITVSASQTISIVMTPVTYTLSGTIHTGSMTGGGLAGATVSVAGKTVTTASNGTFSIDDIPAGSYTYTVTKTGYVSYTSGTFTMNSNLAAATYLAPLPTAYTISGTVRSMTSSGPAIPGATVYLAGKTLTTGSTGSFSASGIAAGTYPINIVAQGYGIYTASLTISANQTLTFCMAPLSYTLSGMINNGSLPGAGLAGATVSLAGQTATTNSAGGFSISGLEPGIYTITASKSGYASFTNNAFSLGGNQSVSISLKPSATTGGH